MNKLTDCLVFALLLAFIASIMFSIFNIRQAIAAAERVEIEKQYWQRLELELDKYQQQNKIERYRQLWPIQSKKI